MEQIGRDRKEIYKVDIKRRNSTITIKINGNEHSYKEEIESDDRVGEAYLIEEPILKEELDVYSEMAASQQAVEDESFDWILPEQSENDIAEYKVVKSPVDTKKKLQKTLKKQSFGPVKSILSSVLLAVVIGTSLGLVVLKLVISDTPSKEEVVAPALGETVPEKNDASGPTQQLILEPLQTYIVQGGVFSTVDSAQLMEQSVKQKGLPAQIIENNEQAILILGAADTIERAKGIANVLMEKEVEVFAKSYTLSEKTLTNLTDTEISLLKNISSTYQSLSAIASSGWTLGSIDETEIAKHKSYIQSIQKEEIESDLIASLLLNLEGAATKLESYQSKPTETLLVEAQQYLLTFIKNYLSL
jgi:stage II sporulation protein B